MTVTLWHTVRTASRNLASVLALTATLGVGASVVGVLPAQALRRDVKDDTAYTIKRVYKAGETDRYRLTTNVKMDNPQTGGPLDIVTSMLMKDSTKEAKEDGTSTSVSEFDSASVQFNGMDLDITTMMPKMITTRYKNGKSDTKMEGGNEQVTSQIGEQMKQFTLSSAAAFLPSKPIKVGDTWDMDSAALGAKGQKVKGKVTFVSVDTVKGVKVAKFKTVTDVAAGADTKLHSESTTLVDVATGKPVSVTSKTDGDTGNGKLKIEMTLKMLGPDDKADSKEAVKADSNVKKP